MVLNKLVKLKVVEAQEQTASAVVEDDALGGEACRLPLEGAPPSKADSRDGSISGEEVEVGKPPATSHHITMIPFLLPPVVWDLKRRPTYKFALLI